MTGTDGRLYDSHFDYNHDGKLDPLERDMFDQGNPSYPGPKPYPVGKGYNPMTMMYHCGGLPGLIAGAIWIVGFLFLIVFPPIGVILIGTAATITEKYR